MGIKVTQRFVSMNATIAQNQKAFAEQYNSYVERFDAANSQLQELEKEKALRQSRAVAFDAFITALKQSPDCLTELISAILWQKAYNCRDTTIPMVIERK